MLRRVKSHNDITDSSASPTRPVRKSSTTPPDTGIPFLPRRPKDI